VHLVPICPVIERGRGELRPIVALDDCRHRTTLLTRISEESGDVRSGKLRCGRSCSRSST
jgi:hypothetical protein